MESKKCDNKGVLWVVEFCFEKCVCFVAALERKISLRAHRDELVQKGILLPESPVSPIAQTPSKFR